MNPLHKIRKLLLIETKSRIWLRDCDCVVDMSGESSFAELLQQCWGGRGCADSYPSSSSHPFFILWILSAVVSSCFTYTWDIKMDWGLFDSNAAENRFLREEIVYSSSGYYYFAILTDLALRFGWTLSVSLTELGVIHSDLMVTILAPLEVFRRFVWNFFRLENEHLNNCGKFRAVRDISVAPIDAGNQALLVRMMDEPCGVINRGGAARRDLRKRANKHKKPSLETKVLLEESDDVVDV